MLFFFLKGIIIGFSIAAPVGPIGLLCIQRSLNEGFKVGLLTGLGAATADALYGLIAGFGLTAVSAFLVASKSWIQLFGGLFLIYLGAKLLKTQNEKSAVLNSVSISPAKAYGTTFVLTLTNPMTILSFAAVFAGLGVGATGTNHIQATSIVTGVLIGSSLWWFFLSGGVAYVLHGKIGDNGMRWINILSASVILLYGCFALCATGRQ
jgi:threonine/homoserine/homoserine lactone efflux protein